MGVVTLTPNYRSLLVVGWGDAGTPTSYPLQLYVGLHALAQPPDDQKKRRDGNPPLQRVTNLSVSLAVL